MSVCPFLLCLLLPGGRDRMLRRVCWIALVALIVPLWTHGNAGGMQFSYRYAMVLLPWIWVLLLDRRGGKVSPGEWALFALSVFVSTWACYLCFWTKLVFG